MGCLLRGLLMLVLPFAFFWVPVPGLGGFLAGCIGGYLSGGPLRAVLSALVPFIILAGLIVAIGFRYEVPLLGSAVAGLAMIFLGIQDLVLLTGALVGGWVWRFTGGGGEGGWGTGSLPPPPVRSIDR